MRVHVYSRTLDTAGVRFDDRHLRCAAVAGVSILPVHQDDLAIVRTRYSAVTISADEARDKLVAVVETAAAEVDALAAELADDVKRLRCAVAKEGRAAAEAADVSTLRGIADEIAHAARHRPTGKAEKNAVALDDILDDATLPLAFDPASIKMALTRLHAAQQKREDRLADLRSLAQQVGDLIVRATDPAVLQKIRDDGREVQLRAWLPSVVDQVRVLHQQAAENAARMGQLLAALEAAR
ncbi:MAG TPA: hypothetical protein VED40_23175 [Azospirillaceae bacterium]|nr:hypothetical protein [Azospirillaceae bacterium]